MIKIIGIDPGIANIGFAILGFENGILKEFDLEYFKTTNEDEQPIRLAKIYTWLRQKLLTPGVQHVAIESYYTFGRQNNNSRDMHQAIGVMLACIGSVGLNHQMVTPMQAKKSFTGSSKAGKKDMKKAAQLFLKSDKKISTHVADAVGIAVFASKNVLQNTEQLEAVLPLWQDVAE